MTEEQSIGQLVAQASRDVSDLVRHEVALAKAELREDLKQGAVGGGLFGAAGYLTVLASILLTIAAAYGLRAAGLPAWAAFLVEAVALLVIAVLLALVGRAKMRSIGPPERAIRTTKLAVATILPGSRNGAATPGA